MTISYLAGDATAPQDGVIAHVCNDRGGWGAGFVLAISARWPGPEAAYRELAADGGLHLGQVQLVPVSPDLTVANMVAQHGYRHPGNPVPLHYHALAQCLGTLAGLLKAGTVIHMPRIGCGLAGGRWPRVEALLDEYLPAFDVRVYDLPGDQP